MVRGSGRWIPLIAFIVAALGAASSASPAHGQSYRDPVTGFEIQRARTAILVDPALRTAQPASSNGHSRPIWARALDTVQWFIERLPAGSEYVVMFGDEVLDPGGTSRWLHAGDTAEREQGLAALGAAENSHDVYLGESFEAAMALRPSPERILLIVGEMPGPDAWPRGTEAKHLESFNAAVRKLKGGVPVDVLLMPLLTEANVAPAHWVLALRTGGSLLTVGRDWPGVARDGLFDADYVSFVVDTSGSMQNFQWQLTGQRIDEILSAQRHLRFFQIVSDSGQTLLKKSGPWIEATPERRAAALREFGKWKAASTSTPTRGLAIAIAQARGVSNAAVYLITDDWAKGVRLQLDQNPDAVPVSTIALPTIYDVTGGQLYTAAHLATFGHEIAVRTGGVFVGVAANPELATCAAGQANKVPVRCMKRGRGRAGDSAR